MTTIPVSVAEAVPGPRPADLDDAFLVGLFRTMCRIRRFEEQVIDAYNARLIPGSTHPCIGQEAAKAGSISAIRDDDLVLATYRGHGEAIAKGVDPLGIMAELMARVTGICKGKGGSMHLAEPVGRTRLDERDRRRPHPDRGRRRALVQAPRHRPGRALLLR